MVNLKSENCGCAGEMMLRLWQTYRICFFIAFVFQSSFLFPGVYVNSTQAIPFLLQNKGVARAKVEFDLSQYEDFSLSFKEDSGTCLHTKYNTSLI